MVANTILKSLAGGDDKSNSWFRIECSNPPKVEDSVPSVIISNVQKSGITDKGATVTWDTDKPSTSQVEYGPTAWGFYGPTVSNDTLTTSHSINITGLTPNTDYNFRAISTITGYTAKSDNYTLRTGDTGSPTDLSISSSYILSDGVKGTAYSETLQVSGGKSPYTWSITDTLPAGLSLDSSSGIISGTPTATGTTAFTVKVEDSSSPKLSDTKSLSIEISGTSGSALSISTSSLPDGTKGRTYSQTLQVSGGKSPYTWSISLGTLPAGLSLNSATGVISGTPTVAASIVPTVCSYTNTLRPGNSKLLLKQ